MENQDILEVLRTIWTCRRCSCPACGRGGYGELHDHVCTGGKGCVNAPKRLLSFARRASSAAWHAAEEIKTLRARLAEAEQQIGRLTGMDYDAP